MNGADVLDWRAWAGRSSWVSAIALGAVVALVLFLGWFVLLRERHGAYQAGQAQAQALNQALEEKTHALSLREPAEEALDEAVEQLRDARWRLSAGVGMSDLLDELARSGHGHGLVFEQLDVEPVRSEIGYQVVPLQVMVIGRYPALRLWLDEWFDQVRLLRATNLQLDGVPDRPRVLRLQLRVESYHPGEVLEAPASLAHEPARPAARAPRVDLFTPWSVSKATAGLAGVPLAQLEMVGSLSRQGRHQALLWSAGRLYRVSPGDRLGRNEGVVVQIDRQQVEVRERVYAAGTWHERTVYLAIRKRMDNGGMDEAEDAANGGGGGAGVEPGRDSTALSG